MDTPDRQFLWLGETDVAKLMTLADGIDVLDRAYGSRATAGSTPLPRAHARHSDSLLHSVGGILPAAGVAGVKSWLYTPSGASPLLTLWDLDTGAVVAVVEAFLMGQLRTAATSGLATRLLARDDADVLALLGTGKQAFAQAIAVATVRELGRIQVYGRSEAPREALCRRLQDQLGIEIVGTDNLANAVRGADVITAITRAAEPFISASHLSPGVHVNAVGSIVASRRELDEAAVAKCDVVVVDSREQARDDAGELIAAANTRAWDWSQVATLSDVVVDPTKGRGAPDDITLFKAVGVGLSDVALGAELLTRARQASLGTQISATDEHTSPAMTTES